MGPVYAAAFSDDSVNPRVRPIAVVTATIAVDAWITVAGRRRRSTGGPRPPEMANLFRGSTDARQEHSTTNRPGEMVKADGAGQESLPRK